MSGLTPYLLPYLATLLVVAVLDALWLGVVARSFYAQGIGHLMAERPFWPAAAGFYLLYPVGLMVLAVWPSGGDLGRALALGLAAGLFAYGTYDLTNLAVLRDWPWRVAVVDIAWGAFVSAAGAGAGAWALRVAASGASSA